MHLRHFVLSAFFVLACTTMLYAQDAADIRRLHAGGPPVLLTDAEFAIWQKAYRPQEIAKEKSVSTTPNTNTAANEFLSSFARHWPRTYRVSCTTRTSGSKGTYRTDTTCY